MGRVEGRIRVGVGVEVNSDGALLLMAGSGNGVPLLVATAAIEPCSDRKWAEEESAGIGQMWRRQWNIRVIHG